jgi:ubiquinol-cytochrome c reductase cytochrome b subunit
MHWLKHIYYWIDRRVQLGGLIKEAALHPVPKTTASWLYVFGSAALTVLIVQIVTGILLAISYVPSAAEAWTALQDLNHQVPMGWFLRGVHGWGSNFMVAIVIVHMVQVFLFGAYKYPRELTWITGVFLLLMTLGMAFTGQVLRFDQDAYWGLGIGVSIAGRVPAIGGQLVHLLLGGATIGTATLTRFFALHVFVIPGTLLAFVGLHLWMVLKLGINEWPMPGRIVRRDTYIKEYNELAHRDGIPFVPGAIWKDLVFAAGVILAVIFCAAMFGPFGPSGVPDPTIIQTYPRPDPPFLWLYSLLALLPPSWETPALLIGPPVAIVLLIALPLVAGVGEKSWKRRPIAVLTVLVVAVAWAVLTRLASNAPWSPKMTAWSGTPVPTNWIEKSTPLVRQGALVFQYKQCRSCHALGGEGGQRGPALDEIAVRMTRDQMIRQVIQGGGNMPAFGKNLSPPEVTALVTFLETLHRPTERPARNPANAVTEGRPTGDIEKGARY